jgi:hypothetical protein
MRVKDLAPYCVICDAYTNTKYPIKRFWDYNMPYIFENGITTYILCDTCRIEYRHNMFIYKNLMDMKIKTMGILGESKSIPFFGGDSG